MSMDEMSDMPGTGQSSYQIFIKPILNHFKEGNCHLYSIHDSLDLRQIINEMKDQVVRSSLISKSHGCQDSSNEGLQLLIRLEETVFVHLSFWKLTVYSDNQEKSADYAKNLYIRFSKPKHHLPGFLLLSSSFGGIDAERIELDSPVILDSNDLEVHYGREFVEWEKRYVARLSERRYGITLFQGPTGCGKTTFIKHLISTLQNNHRFFFIPVASFDMITSSDMTEFWLREQRRFPSFKRVIILEDCEKLFADRSNGSGDRFSNILNLSDGLLGEFQKVQILCTSNIALNELDDALKRPGRLIAHRKFDRMKPAQAQRLAKEKGLKLQQQEDYSLAEIYYGEDDLLDSLSERKIGFD